MPDRYRIVRMYQRGVPRIIQRGLDLRAAQSHCKSLETSSKTALSPAALEHTRKYGPWFDGYEEDV